MSTTNHGLPIWFPLAALLFAFTGGAGAQAPLSGQEADIVFIYDNSASMWSHYAQIDSAEMDTAFYMNTACGRGGFTPSGTPLTYSTTIGLRTIQLLPSSVSCGEPAGDPYFARTWIISQAIDYLASHFPNSTAGAIAFSYDTSHVFPPLILSATGNVDSVKKSLVLDSLPSTNYLPPLRLATAWLTDSALTRADRKAIIFISDGEPNDASAFTTWLNGNVGIPMYTIALGDSTASFTRMQQMSLMTNGRFNQIDPRDVIRMGQTMEEIIRTIVLGGVPSSIGVARESLPSTGRRMGGGALPDALRLFEARGSTYDLRGRLFPVKD